MRFLKIYRSVKDVFVKPKLKWYFGSWKKEPNLPVWRRGPTIYLTKSIGWSKGYKAYYPENRVNVFEGYSDHKYYGKIKRYSWSYHKLPGKLNGYKPVWNRNIRKKLRKWHLSWIPPVIQLPIWLTFRFDDSDICWKTKWTEDDFRYEFPAHICLVVFGFAISITAIIPDNGFFTRNDDYWESLLIYRNKPNLDDVNDKMGWWSGETLKHWRLRPEFLKEPYKTQLIAIQNEFNEGKVDKIS